MALTSHMTMLMMNWFRVSDAKDGQEESEDVPSQSQTWYNMC